MDEQPHVQPQDRLESRRRVQRTDTYPLLESHCGISTVRFTRGVWPRTLVAALSLAGVGVVLGKQRQHAKGLTTEVAECKNVVVASDIQRHG